MKTHIANKTQPVCNTNEIENYTFKYIQKCNLFIKIKYDVRKRLNPTFQYICHLMSPDILDDPERKLRNFRSKLLLVRFHRRMDEGDTARRLNPHPRMNRWAPRQDMYQQVTI